ncbi:hypothetical protein NIES4101_31270 [Calothrix sp. NIES-4101]|nr:hypothetical protein NIES4101_31270 [Calothrix sp. NIES-4101]
MSLIGLNLIELNLDAYGNELPGVTLICKLPR